MNEFIERSPGERSPALAGVRDGEHIDLSGREGVYQWRSSQMYDGPCL